MFTINNKGRVCWIQRGEDRPQINIIQNPIQVHVWGAIWWSGQSTLWIGTGNINESVYIDILATHLLPCMPNSARYSLLQDNARPYTANHSMAFLAANNINIMQNYPARSPDFNAIEHVWEWMKQNVAAKSPTTCLQLVKYINEARHALTTQHWHNYISHIHDVMLRCINADGDFAD